MNLRTPVRKSGHGAPAGPVIECVPHVRCGRGFGCQVEGMTRRLVRWQREGDLHFVTAICWHRLPYLRGLFCVGGRRLEAGPGSGTG